MTHVIDTGEKGTYQCIQLVSYRVIVFSSLRQVSISQVYFGKVMFLLHGSGFHTSPRKSGTIPVKKFDTLLISSKTCTLCFLKTCAVPV